MSAKSELIILKCIRNEVDGQEYPFKIGDYYLMDSISIGQSHSSVIVDGKSYNSILFNYYKIKEDKLIEFDIYRSEHSPYYHKSGE